MYCTTGAPGVRTPIGTGGIGRDEKNLCGKEANCIWRGAWRPTCHRTSQGPEFSHSFPRFLYWAPSKLLRNQASLSFCNCLADLPQSCTLYAFRIFLQGSVVARVAGSLFVHMFYVNRGAGQHGLAPNCRMAFNGCMFPDLGFFM